MAEDYGPEAGEQKDYRCQTLEAMASAAERGKSYFGKTAKEILNWAYDTPAEGWVKEHQSWLSGFSFGATTRKVAQGIHVFGSYLYQDNPKFTCHPDEWSGPEALGRSQVAQHYLNYIKRENGLKEEIRSSFDSAISAGLGVVWIGTHPDKPGVALAVNDSWKNLLIDPNATCMRDADWIGRKRFKPKHWLRRTYPDHAKKIDQMETRKRPTDAAYEKDEYSDDGAEGIHFTEYYLRRGLHNFKGGLKGEQGEDGSLEADDGPVKIVKAGDTVLYEGPWETPFHLEGGWPCELLWFYDRPESVWPIAPFEASLPWIKAYDYAVTITLAKYKWASRKILAVVNAGGFGLSEEAVSTALESTDAIAVLDVALADVGADQTDVRKYLQDISFSADINEALAILSMIKKEFEDHSGLTDLLLTGQTDKQDRSAEAARNRRESALARINDMVSRGDDFLSRLGRKLWLTAVYHYDPEDEIAPLLGQELAATWPKVVAEGETDPFQLAEQMQSEMPAIPPQVILQTAMQLTQNAVTFRQLLAETQFGVEAGSTRRKTPELQLEALTDSMNQTVPQLLQMPYPEANAMAFRTIAAYYRESGLPSDLTEGYNALAEKFLAMAQQPPPPADMAGAPPQGPPAQAPQGMM